ncbi:MAG TPA: SdrD B-like domain-containing protein [Thermoanaerobaculia bacterium]|nr:SdrD B-like domain-containing protein [Thermoanaerobaculia bacterium]
MNHPRWKMTTSLPLALALLGLTFGAQSQAAQFKCFPSCSTTDAKFLVIASGPLLVTLSDPVLDIELAAPAGTSSFQIGFFDGDSGGAHWDAGGTIPYSFTLYADPQATGSTATVVEMVPGFPSVSSLTMPDNAWIDFTVNTTANALSPSGNYFYRLHIELLNTSVNSLNSFKLRTTGVSTVRLEDQPFSYMATLATFADILTLYPGFPSLTPTTYDGDFRFFFYVLDPGTDIAVWDGDFDHGKYDGTVKDTDDPDTPNAPFLPSWATADAVSEGVAVGLPTTTTGNPADDASPADAIFLRPPSVRYDLIFPDGQTFANDNPSGNQEWEQFRISTDPFDPSLMDYSTTTIPGGTYELRATGVDLSNLNALRLPDRALCVSDTFVPCTPLFPFLVGDTVFRDLDGNGTQSGAEETGIAGATVEIVGQSGAVIGTTTTDASGHYAFNVPAGTYTVRVAASNFGPGGPLAGTIATTPAQHTDTVVDNNVLTYDFGYRGTGSIGDRLWYDLDNDGVEDSGEGGINGVTVELLDGGGNVVSSATTAGDGNYSFGHLFAGTYRVRVVTATLPAGLAATYDLDGTGSANVATLTLAAGATRNDVDFGYRGTASIGDRVWYDIDGNGAQDSGEDGLNGVTVRLRDSGGNVVAAAVTSGDGNYSFGNLPAGTYTVEVDASTLPGGASPTFDADGTVTPDAATVSVVTGQNLTEVDFGYRGTAALGDRVWYDINNNGAQDPDEVGLNGVTVELLDGGGNVVRSTVTSGNGGYGFAGLFAGTYTVRVVAATLPGGAVATFDLDGTGTAHTATASVATGQNLSTVDFGYRGTASLGDRVWLDLDGDAFQDSGEPGLNGVAVELLNGAGTVLASSSTTAAGIYGFNYLLAGSYSVRVVTSTLPPGLVQTYDLDGTGTAHTAALTLSSGQSRADVDFGYRGTLQFGDRVWFDYDGNGIQDTGEPGIPSVTIELRNSSGTLISTTITGSNGLYSFYNLPAGTYTVTVVASTLPAGTVPTYDLDGTATPNTAGAVLTSGQNRTDVDFGYRGTASLGDRVWLDYDIDGVQDTGENGINGVTVQLLDAAGNVIASAVTSGDGNYTFPNLLAGTYKVKVISSTLPAGAVQTYDLDGTGTAHIATVTVAGGQSRSDADFGYRLPAPGTGTIGYWKTHPEAWPVSSITIGGVVYTRDQAIVLFDTPSRGDKSIDLFKQLVAAKLNLIVGNNPSCIYQTIASADAWMTAHPPGSNVGSSSAAWTQASPWHTQLDNYNNGRLCAPHRD